MDAKARAERVAGRQYGAISLDQCRACNLSIDQVRQLVRSGRWVSAERAVYVISGSVSSWERRAIVVVLSCGPGARLSHAAAAYVLGLTERRPDVIDVTLPSGRNRHPSGARVHNARLVDRSDVRMARGMPVTCPARTLVDVASVFSRRALSAVLDTALLRGLVTIGVVRRYIDERRLHRLPGVGVLTKLLDDRERGVPESELEREFLDVVERFALPVPMRQRPVGRYRVDFAYPERRILIELDGRATHGTAEAFEDDPVRQNALVLEGWMVLRFTWRQVTEQPDFVAETVARALGVSARPTRGRRTRDA